MGEASKILSLAKRILPEKKKAILQIFHCFVTNVILAKREKIAIFTLSKEKVVQISRKFRFLLASVVLTLAQPVWGGGGQKALC